MKITIENTPKIVDLHIGHMIVPARIWQGETDDGIPVHCFVTRIVPEVPQDDPDFNKKHARFQRELLSTATPRQTIEAIPLRLIL